MAYEAEVDLDVLKAFEEFNKTTPTILKIYPSGDLYMEDFWKAGGGVPRILENLQTILDTDVLTCTGKSMIENINSYRYTFPPNDEIIRKPDNPFSPTGGYSCYAREFSPRYGHQQASSNP